MSTMSDPLIGMVLPRRYRIMSLLGRGSMSVVYKGTYEPLDQLVAIKMLKSHLVSDPHQAKRFQQEIKTAGNLSHPNIVGILDFGFTDQGVPYLIMEYLEGKSIAEALDIEDRLSVNRVTRIFSQAADALAYAHREGVVHRDIKPSNIIIVNTEDEKDIVKIVDFGIAKLQTAGSTDEKSSALGLTGTGEVLGTPLYMSPEQSQGKELDGRSDIYSFGCVMYHALTGKPPFVGDTALDTIRLQITATATPIEIVRPDLFFPDRMQAIINRALAKDPRMRYQRMEHLKADIDSCGKKEAVSSMRVPRYEEPTPAEPEPGFHLPTMNLPTLCVAIGVLIAIGTAVWGIATNVGQKEAEIKISLPIPSDDAWRKANAAGESASSEGKYDEAEKRLQEALIEARKFKQPDARTARTLINLSQVYYEQDKLAEAQKVCEEALSTANAVGPKEPSIADALANLSRILCATGDYTKASKVGRQALSIREQTLGPAHHEVANSLQDLAEIDCKQGNFAKAGDTLTTALSIAEKALGPDNPEVASIVHNLGLVRERQAKYSMAHALFSRALGIRQRFLGTEHPLVSDTMCALGTLNFNLRKDEAAETMFNNALDIRMKVFGERSSKTAEVYSCLAILYDTEHKYPQAEECYRKAVEIRQALWGAASPRLVRSLQHLARFLREHGQKSGAEVYEAQIKRIKTS